VTSAQYCECHASVTVAKGVRRHQGSIEPDTVSINTVFRTLATAKRPSETFLLLELIVALGVKLSASTASIAMAMLVAANEADKAILIWQRLHTLGVRPNTSCYNARIDALVHLVRTHIVLVHIMKSFSYIACRFQVSAWSVYYKRCFTLTIWWLQGRWNDALDVYKFLAGPKPPVSMNAATLEIMMSGYMLNGNPDGALATYRTLSQVPAATLTTGMLNIALDAHSALGCWMEAIDILRKGVAARIADSTSVCSVVVQLVSMVSEALKQPNGGMVTAVLNATSEVHRRQHTYMSSVNNQLTIVALYLCV
jgi:hypothetical protein